MLATRAADNVSPVAFCNLVGGQDELVFDGDSLVFDERGELMAAGRAFAEDLVVVRPRPGGRVPRAACTTRAAAHGTAVRGGGAGEYLPVRRLTLDAVAAGARAAVSCASAVAPELDRAGRGLRARWCSARATTCARTASARWCSGSRGGIDSALTACIAVDALGAAKRGRRLDAVALHVAAQRDDAEELARRARHPAPDRAHPGRRSTPTPRCWRRASASAAGPTSTEENLQARIRGNLLMALSNKFGWLVLTTGNKSEIAVGYCTLYGDMAGGFAVIKDVPKTLVYGWRATATAWRSRPPRRRSRSPRSSGRRRAELRPDQTDEDSLPPYACSTRSCGLRRGGPSPEEMVGAGLRGGAGARG